MENSIGLSGLFYLSHSSSCPGIENLETAATPLQPVCFKRVCEKWRRGVWDYVCLSWSRSQGVVVGGGGIVWWIGRQVCCSALPTAGASHHALHALSQNSLWPWVWRQISRTLANSNKFFFVLFFMDYPLSPFSYFYSFTLNSVVKNVSDFYGMWGTLISWSRNKPRALIWQYK